MSAAAADCIVYRAEDLLPEAWRGFLQQGPVRAFNPGLLRGGDGWLFAYRVVGPDGRRRIAICRLDDALRVVPGSARPLTDHVRFPRTLQGPDVVTQWFADPRLYRLAGRLFVYWNSGWHEPRNWQFLQELDPATLHPVGPPRELVLRGERQKLEKNWTMFTGGDGQLYCVYSITPHRVLRFDLAGQDAIAFEDFAEVAWSIANYPACHGGLRGGAPPVEGEGGFWSFCHSVHDGSDGYCYAAALYRFAAEPPFAPAGGPAPLSHVGRPFSEARVYPRLNPAVGEVIYPCGAARDGARWLVSHGINDERCAISVLAHEELVAALRPDGVPA